MNPNLVKFMFVIMYDLQNTSKVRNTRKKINLSVICCWKLFQNVRMKIALLSFWPKFSLIELIPDVGNQVEKDSQKHQKI
jgi:hypothetical protein